MIFGFNTDVKYGAAVYHVQSEARENELLLQTQVFVKGRCIGKRATSYAGRMQEPGFSDDQMHELLKDQHRRMVEAVRAGRIEAELGVSGPGVSTATMPAVPAVAGSDAGPVVPARGRESVPKPAVFPEFPLPPPAQAPPAMAAAPTADAPAAIAAPTLTERVPPLMEAPALPREPLPQEPPPRLQVEDFVTGKGISLECANPDSAYQDGCFRLRIQVGEEGEPVPGAQLTWRLTVGQVRLQQAYATTDAAGEAEIEFSLSPAQIEEASVLLQASHREKSVSRRFRFRK